MKRKWRENEEIEREWGNGEGFTLNISSFLFLVHTGEKLHYCNLCDFVCAWAIDLSKYLKTHSEEKSQKWMGQSIQYLAVFGWVAKVIMTWWWRWRRCSLRSATDKVCIFPVEHLLKNKSWKVKTNLIFKLKLSCFAPVVHRGGSQEDGKGDTSSKQNTRHLRFSPSAWAKTSFGSAICPE